MDDAPKFKLRVHGGEEYGPADLAMIRQWALEGRVPRDGVLAPTDGSPERPVMSEPALAAALQAPPTTPRSHFAAQPGVRRPDDSTPGPAFIPTRNPCALAAYYLGVFAFIPFLGFLLGLPAIILGVIGLVQRSRRPQIRGLAHAILGIVLGIAGPLIGTGLFFFAANALEF